MRRGTPNRLVREVVDNGKNKAVDNRDCELRASRGERKKNAGRKQHEKKGEVEACDEAHLYILFREILR